MVDKDDRARKLGMRLRQARKRKGYTQKQLGDVVGVVQQTIQKLEAGAMKRPSREIIVNLANALDVSPGWLAFEMEELDQLDNEAVELALQYRDADPKIQEAVKALLSFSGKRSDDSHN